MSLKIATIFFLVMPVSWPLAPRKITNPSLHQNQISYFCLLLFQGVIRLEIYVFTYFGAVIASHGNVVVCHREFWPIFESLSHCGVFLTCPLLKSGPLLKFFPTGLYF